MRWVDHTTPARRLDATMREARRDSPSVGGTAIQGSAPRMASPLARASSRETLPRKTPLGGTRTPTTGANSNHGGDAPGARTPVSRRKTIGAPRTPLGTISASANVAPGALPSPGAPRSPLRVATPASPGRILNTGSPSLNDSSVSEHVNYNAETLAREPTDEDVDRQLRSAIDSRHENQALREHIENLKNSEIDQGLAASERVKEMSSEYANRVDHLTREKATELARAEAAEAESHALAEVLRANGRHIPTLSADAHDPDVSIGGDGVSATPAADLFASPSPTDANLDFVFGDIGIGAGEIPRTHEVNDEEASFDFGGGSETSGPASDWTKIGRAHV